VTGAGNSLTLVTPGTTGDILFDQAVSGIAGATGLTIQNAQDVVALSTINATSFTQQAGSGNTTLSGLLTTTGPAGVSITTNGLLTVGGGITTGGNPVLLAVNDLVLNSVINAGAGAVTVTAQDTTRAINLGGAGGLALSAAELASVTTSNLFTIGAANHSGAMTVAGAINPSNATGGLTLLNQAGGIAINAPLTYTAGAGNLTLTANGGGAVTGAVTDNGSGLLSAPNLILNAASGIGTAANPVHITGGTNTSANNTTSGGVFLSFPIGDINLAGLNNGGAGVVGIQTTDGSINVNGAVTASGAVELTANATGGAPRTLDINAPITANGKVILRAADDITIDAQVSSGGGDTYIVAGRSAGMNLPGITMSDGSPVTPAGEAVADTDGGITINAKVLAGAGNMVLNATEAVLQPSGVGGGAGLQNTGALTVRTYNDAPGGAIIDLRNDNNPNGNGNGPVTLETRFASDASAPGEPVAYAASNIDYRSYTGVVLQGIGTGADFIAIAATQNIDLQALGIQAKNLTLIANAGDVLVNTQVTDAQINSGSPGGSLNLFASGNVNVNHVAGTGGVTIGRVLPSPTLDPVTGLPLISSIEKFDHDLKLVSQGNINIQGSIYLQGDLKLRADASLAEATMVGATPGYGDGIGSVNISVPGTDPVVISAGNITVGTLDTLNRPLPVQNLTLTAGNAAPGASVKQSPSASIEALGALDIFLTGDMVLAGGTITANNPVAGTAIENSAVAKVAGNVVTIRGLANSDNPLIPGTLNNSNIVLTGGTATAMNQGAAKAEASAVILALQSAAINVGGDITMTGGNATADGVSAVATAIAGTEIGTLITGSELLNSTSRSMYITGGTGTSLNGGNPEAFTSLASSGAIRITVTGQGVNEGLVLEGAGGSGMFDALGSSLIRVSGKAYPITVSGQILLVPSTSLQSQDALVVAGAPLIDESLLAAFLRATEAAREDTLGEDPNLQRDSKGQAGVCR
jgi:filamentous hemagglutinin